MGNLRIVVLLIFFLNVATAGHERPKHLLKQNRSDVTRIARLSTNLVPLNYVLDLKVNLPGYGANISKEDEFTTEGHLNCAFQVVHTPTNIIQLHVGKELQIESVYFTTRFPKVDVSSDVTWLTTYDTYQEILTINIPQEMETNQFYNVSIRFRGRITYGNKGLYYSLYDENEYYAVTQFEATYARSMTPCFDEPSFKAYWDVRITHPQGTEAVSNGHLLNSVKLRGNDTNFIQSTFATTPYTSSYLLAILVSNFGKETGYTKDGVVVRGFAHQKINNPLLKKAVNYTIQTIEILEDVFGIRPILNKSDFVFAELAYGGMENWNLIVYSDTYLQPSPMAEMDLIDVIVHEVTHQWFGNLVTAKWWNELWLNEGLTSYVTCIVAERIGNLSADKCFSKAQRQSFEDNSRSLVNEVQKHNMNQPPKIVYYKGCAFTRMLQELVGQHKLFESLKAYLRKHAYRNTETSDLMAEIQPFIKTVNMTKFGEQWTKQIGYPIVMVEQIDFFNYRLTQKSYPPKNTAKFDVPIFNDIMGGKYLMLTSDTPEMIVTTRGGYPVINGKKAGVYKVEYDEGWQGVLSQELPDLLKNNINDDRQFFQGVNRKHISLNIQEPESELVENKNNRIDII